MFDRLRRSLSFRLLVIFLIMAVLFAYGAVLGIRWVFMTDELRDLVSGHLSLHVEYVKADIGDPPRIDRALSITRQVPVDIRISGPNLDWASDPSFPKLNELSFGSSDIFSEQADGWLQGVEGVEFAVHQAHTFLRIDKGPYAIIVSSPKISQPVAERQLTPIIMGVGLFLVLLTYLAVRWLFMPIGAIRRGAAQIGRGNFAHRITQVRKDQLGDLAEDINHMADDVERMLDAKRQLLLGISHELRSPLSRMKLALELAGETDENQALGQDVAEMEKIIATLLEAERLNSRHAPLHVTRVSARSLVDQLIENYFSRDRARIQTEIPEDLQLNVDQARVTLMLKNLVSNALRHTTVEDGPVVLEISEDRDAWTITVRDHGPGISHDQIPFLGEPFYRGDPSRTRSTGGSGLGLYLARMVAEAHGGTLALDQTYTDGACFKISLPFEPS